MPDRVILGHGGSRKDKLSVELTPVDFMTDEIPQRRQRLPLIDQPGRITGDKEFRLIDQKRLP
jgi:hypothetical protein